VGRDGVADNSSVTVDDVDGTLERREGSSASGSGNGKTG
jgi:hypothetical protein